MATKQLSVIVQAVDRSTAGLRVIANGVLGVGNAAGKSDVKTTAFLGRMLGGLTSLKGLLGVAAAGFGAFRAVGSFNAAAKELDDLNDMATRLGLSIEHLSELRYISRLSGVDLETLAGGISTLQKNTSQFVATGGGRAADVIRRLGVRLTDTNGQVRETSELLPEIAAALQRVGGQAEQLEVVKRLFGDERFLQFIRESPEALSRMAEEARRLGVIFTPEQAKAAAEYSDALDRVKEAWLGLRIKLMDQLGPTLAEWLNQGASFLAAIPKMLGNLVENIKKAIGGDSEAKGKFTAFTNSLLELSRTGVQQIWRVITATSHLGLLQLMSHGGWLFGQWIQTMLAKTPYLVSAAINRMELQLSKNYLPKFLSDRDEKIANERLAAIQTEIDLIERKAAQSRGTLKTLDDMTRSMLSGSSSDWAQFNGILADSGQELRKAAGGVFVTADALLGASAALAATSIAGAEATRLAGLFAKTTGDAEAGTWKWSEALEGVRARWKQLAIEVNDATSWGASFASQISEQISGGLTTALLDGVSGVKSLGEAFREWGASTLRMISEVITKMMILRLVNSVGGALLGGGGGIPTQFRPGAGVNLLGDIPGARRGGVMLPSGLMAYGLGDIVAGARLGRDYRPAVLAAGEGVLNTAAVSRNGASMVHYMNGGGRVQPAGGGGTTIHVENHITVQGGGSMRSQDLRAISEAATQGVLRGLRNSPALRGEMRGLLA
ncbi:MAG: hypothetical protein WAZ94_13480 [Phycisphaerales bacterium]